MIRPLGRCWINQILTMDGTLINGFRLIRDGPSGLNRLCLTLKLALVIVSLDITRLDRWIDTNRGGPPWTLFGGKGWWRNF